MPQRHAQSPQIPSIPKRIEMTFHTPVRIKQENKNMVASEFNFTGFFSVLLRRISMLTYFHTDTPLEANFAGLTQAAKTKQFTNQQLKWFDWTRYSSRQQTEMNMGGVVGVVELDMAEMEQFWPYLGIGQWTNVGKGTSMGMGAYKNAELKILGKQYFPEDVFLFSNGVNQIYSSK